MLQSKAGTENLKFTTFFSKSLAIELFTMYVHFYVISCFSREIC